MKDQNRLAESFNRSLESWGGWGAKSTLVSDYLTAPISSTLARFLEEPAPIKNSKYAEDHETWSAIEHLSCAFKNVYLNQQLEDFRALDFLLDSLDSPIEAMMLLAIIVCSREFYLNVEVIWNHPIVGERCSTFYSGSSMLSLKIRPQHIWGEYRLDFLISVSGNRIVIKNGKEEREEISKSVVIECDGYDFHERTKEQAKRDKRRDRAIQAAGLQVYRYTGSEIYQDVFKAASEIVFILTGDKLPE